MNWQPITTKPTDRRFYVWMPLSWNGRGPMVETGFRYGYWENEFGNGSAPPNFKPEWWCDVPPPPSLAR